ncbi:MAG: ankyrin repeat domain-containing protein [Gammaproteobacteria bacterium]|nr:MAG: ankyrin repeat domain-containing protein [Gammaproteobacteria bacterium]
MEANKKFKRKSNSTKTVPTFNINLHETDKLGNTPLHIAASNGNLEKVKKLIRYIINIDPSLIEAKNNFGSTPLHYATWFGQLGTVDYLVQQGADLKIKDKYGQTYCMLPH